MTFSESEIVKQFTSRLFKRCYPVFGPNPNKTIDIVIEEIGVLKQIAVTWWFYCSDSQEGFHVWTRTTFNARNLGSPYWQDGILHNRVIVLATGIGESKRLGKTKHRYYMQSDDVFVLGAVYCKFSFCIYSCVIITKNVHPKMAPYHDKDFPCFLPINDNFLTH
ncbi:MAG: putative SOS response-associated peptidase YedK [Paraglaciecola sp.]|jgi:putative SOS response-associated peptidase YedK